MTESADNAVRKNLIGLKDAVVNSDLLDVVSECEQRRLITAAVSRALTSRLNNQTEDERAYGLINNIRRSLGSESVAEKVLDGFLCIVYKRGDPAAQAVAANIANEFKGHLPEYRKLSSSTDETDYPGKSSLFSYPMRSRPHGLALIINNVDWINDPTRKETRHGSDKDADRLKKVLMDLQYDVKLRRNLEATKIKTVLEEIREDIQASHDSFICCILSHGTDKGIEGVDGKYISLQELKKTLYPDNCGALLGKPKLFFVEACREKKSDETHRDGTGANKQGEASSQSLPPDADFFFGNSTVEDTPAYRRTESGSFYIQALCEIFEQHAHNTSFFEMLLAVNNEIATNPALSKHCDKDSNPWQMSESINTLRGNFYFNRQ